MTGVQLELPVPTAKGSDTVLLIEHRLFPSAMTSWATMSRWNEQGLKAAQLSPQPPMPRFNHFHLSMLLLRMWARGPSFYLVCLLEPGNPIRKLGVEE